MTVAQPLVTGPRAANGADAAAPSRTAASPPVIRGALAALLLATLAIAAAYASAFLPGGTPRWAAWAMALGVPLALVAVMALGAARHGHLPKRLLGAFAFVGLLLAVGFGLALALPDDLGAAEPLVFGLPRRAAIIVYGVGLLPTLVLPLAYALTFEAQTLRPEDLERVRAVGRAWRTEAAEAAAAGARGAPPKDHDRPAGPLEQHPADAARTDRARPRGGSVA